MNTLLGFPEGGSALPFGRVLRQWRDARHLSQLALATEAGISTRHLSFLETGRAQPSREMVQLLAGMLDVPLADRNALLISAGYAPIYGDRPLGAPELEPVRRALQFILHQQEPYPALVLDGQWNIVMRNDAARRVFRQFRGPVDSGNVMRTVFDPQGLRPFIVNWEEVALYFLRGVQADAIADGTRQTAELLTRLLAFPGLPALSQNLPPGEAQAPVLIIHFKSKETSLRLFTTIATLGTPHDVTLQEIRVECFFPMDDPTAEIFRGWARGGGGPA